MASQQSALEIDQTADHDDTALGDSNSAESSSLSLQDKILQMIAESPVDRDGLFTIRPTRLALALGQSVEDATAELCSVLAAVPEGSSFHFESNPQKQHIMVFSFPSNFRQQARRTLRQIAFRERIAAIALFLWKCLQIITAFGLIISLLILAIAAALAMIAALVALSRDNQQHGSGRAQRRLLMQQIRHLCLMFREITWCFAVFGPDIDTDDPDRDPSFFREVAYDLALCSSVCCGNGGSIFTWWRIHQLSRRRHRIARGWRRDNYQYETRESEDVEGVRLLRRAKSSSAHRTSSSTTEGQGLLEDSSLSGRLPQQRGALSIAVEFLFGPSTREETDNHAQNAKWKLRAAFLVRQSTAHPGQGVSLQEMGPYTDDPPASLHHPSLISQALVMAAHFQGAPMMNGSNTTTKDDQHSATSITTTSMAEARFVFPELMSESETALRYDPPVVLDESTSLLLLFLPDRQNTANTRNPTSNKDFPTHYHEAPVYLTQLSSTQFYACAGLGLLNLVGVIWFYQSTSSNGVLQEVVEFRKLAQILHKTLVPVLIFYAVLFWVLVLARGLVVMWRNWRIQRRNARRRGLAKLLQEPPQTVSQVL